MDARIDQLWADLRQHREEIQAIAHFGLIDPDDAETAEYHDSLVKMMACIVTMELDRRRMG